VLIKGQIAILDEGLNLKKIKAPDPVFIGATNKSAPHKMSILILPREEK
jgi:hypothetical protein